MRGIEAANQKHLYGVFGDAQWSNKDRLPDPLLKDLIEHFSSLSLGNSRVASDVIGDAYEYLIKQFADATNRKAGEFYTPRSVVRLMVSILDPKEGETVYDPACGTGGMLLAAVAHVRDKGGDPRTFFGRLYGQEKNSTTASVARMNLLLHGIEDFSVERGDTLRSPIFTDPSTGGLATFDCVIANPPFSLEQWGREVWLNDPWGRAFAGLPSDNSGDFAWVQHMVCSMAAHTGRMAVVLPQGRSSAAESRARSGANCWRWTSSRRLSAWRPTSFTAPGWRPASSSCADARSAPRRTGTHRGCVVALPQDAGAEPPRSRARCGDLTFLEAGSFQEGEGQPDA